MKNLSALSTGGPQIRLHKGSSATKALQVGETLPTGQGAACSATGMLR